MEEKVKYYKLMYKNVEKIGNYKEFEIYKINYKILSENIKMKKYYSDGN